MKKIRLLLLAMFLFVQTHAQRHEIDSLKQALQKEKTDTGRILLLSDLGLAFLDSKPDTTIILALQGLELSRKNNYEKGEAVSLNRIASAYTVLGNYPKSMEIYLQALQINEKIHNEEGVSTVIHNIGNIYSNQEDYRMALTYFLKSKAFEEKFNKYRDLSITQSNLSNVYRELKIYDSARLYAQQAYDIATRINYPRIIGNALNTLGRIHFDLGQYHSAMEHYRLSNPYFKESKNDKQLSESYLNMAKVFDKFNLPDSLFYYAKQSIILAKERGFTLTVRDAARFLAFNYRKFNADSSYFYQDISRTSNDSIFSQQKQQQLQNLAFDEKLRQQELEAEALKEKKERTLNLQYAVIFVGLISFIILFFVLGRSIIVTERFIKFFGILGLLAVFEFINLYIHPYLDKWTNHSAFLMLGILICIGAMLVPLHHKLEQWITKIMVEKNKKIRLEAAKKTIAKLEGEQNN